MVEKSEIFADSNFFISLFNPSDSVHQKAIKIKKQLNKKRVGLIITSLIFLEVVTVFSQRVGRKEAILVGKKLLDDERVRVIHIDEGFQARAWKIFRGIARKNTSFVDCSILAVMDAEGIEKLLTFDQEDFAPLRRKHRFSFF